MMMEAMAQSYCDLRGTAAERESSWIKTGISQTDRLLRYDKETGTGGSNGATMRFAPEGDHGANAGLKAARDFLEPIKGTSLFVLVLFQIRASSRSD